MGFAMILRRCNIFDYIGIPFRSMGPDLILVISCTDTGPDVSGQGQLRLGYRARQPLSQCASDSEWRQYRAQASVLPECQCHFSKPQTLGTTQSATGTQTAGSISNVCLGPVQAASHPGSRPDSNHWHDGNRTGLWPASILPVAARATRLGPRALSGPA